MTMVLEERSFKVSADYRERRGPATTIPTGVVPRSMLQTVDV